MDWLYRIIHSDASLNLTEKRDPKIIVTMTSIPPRIHTVHQVVLRMLKQTLRADKIIIYLGKEKFEGIKLPYFLRVQMKVFGVEVRYVEDIGPHTKYFHAINDFPNDLIMTVDDDIRYPNDMIEVLYSSYKKFPTAISARRCHLMTFDEVGQIKKYNEWEHKQTKIINRPSMKLFPTGVGGVLYPPRLMHSEVYNLEQIKKLTFKNDDVWLKFMQVMSMTPVVATVPFVIKHVKGSQKVALNQENVAGQKNDVLIKNVIEAYNSYHGAKDTLLSRIQNNP